MSRDTVGRDPLTAGQPAEGLIQRSWTAGAVDERASSPVKILKGGSHTIASDDP